MKKFFRLMVSAVVVVLAAVACSSAEKMAKQAENVLVSSEPKVLEAVAGQVAPTVSVTYPAGYFHPKAVLKVVPVIVYEGGEAQGEPLYYQGTKVKDNYKVVSSDGGTVKEKISIPYAPGMEKSHLELRGSVLYGGKSVNLPVKKVADGCNTTYMLVHKDGLISYKADNYQAIIKQTEEGQILYAMNSSDVSGSQLSSKSIKSFQAALDEIKANERKTLTGTEVVAYASPDGGQKLNTTLSDKRSQSAEKAFNKVTKGHDASAPEVKSVGQDWEGFQELVAKSDIQDKDLILRVLSMYSDPAVRESEIKNMSEIYTELKGGVLPELRRARFIANVEYKNYTNEELLSLLDANIDVLDEEALLHVATLVEDPAAKATIYKKAADKYQSDRAQFNLGVALLNAGKIADAESAFAKVKTNDGDLKNAKGVIALRKGDNAAASKYFAEAGTKESKANQGVIDILRGNYAKAAEELADAPGCPHNKVLAYILTNQLDKASAAATCPHPDVKYLQAIIAARQGNANAYKTNIEAASKDAALKARAQKDIEFAAFK